MYRDSQYKKKVKLIVNLGLALDYEPPALDKFICKLENRISKYFDSTFQLDNFNLSKMVLMANIDVGNQEKVSSYIKVLQKIGKVKGFSPSSFENIDKNTSFCLDGNSNGIEFLLYDLKEIIVKRHKNADISQKSLKSMIEESKGILRAEVRLTKPKAIYPYTNETDIFRQVAELSKKGCDIFLDTFTRTVPLGDYYKKEKAIEIIQSQVTDSKLRRRMLHLLMLIPEKKSLLLAQKALDYRRINKVMDTFSKINVSPITISKRHDVKQLKCLYSYLVNKK